jgi:hypothetical protein
MIYRVLAVPSMFTGEAQNIYLVTEENTSTGVVQVKARVSSTTSAQSLADSLNSLQ